jgi:hypothetical protein
MKTNLIINEKEYNEAINKEIKFLPIIKNYFKLENLKMTSQYHRFDYQNEDTLIELKTRKIRHNIFPTLMFSNDKIKYGLLQNKKMIFIFEYSDITLYIKYDKELFKKYVVKYINNRSDRGIMEYMNTIFIPLKDMKIMNY